MRCEILIHGKQKNPLFNDKCLENVFTLSMSSIIQGSSSLQIELCHMDFFNFLVILTLAYKLLLMKKDLILFYNSTISFQNVYDSCFNCLINL